MPTIWYQDFNDFLSYENLKVFVPRFDMSYEEMLNSILRFTLYFVIILYLVQGKEGAFPINKAAIVVFIVMIFTFFAYEYVKKSGKLKARYEYMRERDVTNQTPSKIKTEASDKSRNLDDDGSRQSRPCNREPTVDNPFMNVLVSDYMRDSNKHANDVGACDVENTKVKTKINENFNDNLFRDIGDVFAKNASDRQYYTTPNTQIPNNQSGFASWLYKGNQPELKKSGIIRTI